MKRSKNERSPSTNSPKVKNKKRCKEPSPPLDDTVNTPENKPNKNTSRTSGGISKSLLTPCRRMGLNRNRNKTVNTSVEENKSPVSSKKLNSPIPRSIEKSDSNEIKHKPLEKTTLTKMKSENKSPVSSKKLNSPIPRSIEISGSNEIKHKPLEKTILTKMKSSHDVNLVSENVTVNPQVLKIECSVITDGGPIEPTDLKQSCIEIVNKKIGTKKKLKEIPIEHKKLDRQASKTIISSVQSNLSTDCTVSLVKIKELNRNAISLKSVNDSRESSQKSSSSSYISEDDEDDFENKTIIERKCYKNPTKATTKLKIKSKKFDITDSDIEDIKQRIKQKQDRLKTISKSEDSQNHSIEELENLITSWRGGCQKALEELLNLSKQKGSFKENMGMDDLLNMLNIPFELVKYKSEQMSFE